jgi:hypothetical protein
VRSALRARERQYETRAHLMEREQADQRKDEFLATLHTSCATRLRRSATR